MTDRGAVSRRPGAGVQRWLPAHAAVAALVVAATVAVVVVALVDRRAPGPASEPATAVAGPGTERAAGVGSGGCADDELRQPLERFAEVSFEVTSPDGSPAFSGCALLAETPEARARGLMGQDDLLGYDAMVFRFPAPSTSSFYMFRTPLPLSIAFVDATGGVVSTTDMEPCPAEEAGDCPTHAAAAPYLHAVEVAQGDLPAIGIVPGATVTFEEEPA